jgi:hypothetical protein
MIYDDEPRRRRHYPIWNENRIAAGSPKPKPKPKPRIPVISRPKRDLIVRIAQQHRGWSARDIHQHIRYGLGRNDVSLRVITRVLTKMS